MNGTEKKFLAGLLLMYVSIVPAVSNDDNSSIYKDDLDATISVSSGAGDAEPATQDIYVANTEGQAYATQCDGTAVCIEKETGLPLQVLPRAFSNIYKSTSADNGNIIEANVEAFVPLYVFAQQDVDLSDPANPAGWYQVGKNPQSVKGWMQARDVMEWKQALVVSYTHPGDAIEGRKPILMFKDLTSLEKVIAADDVEAEADKIYRQIENGDSVEGVISKEPDRYVNIKDKLYILPILDWKEDSLDGEDIKLLKIAAAVPNARGSDTLDNQDYVENANIAREDGTGANLENLKVDIVFVIDTTRSMQPYIDATRQMLDNIATKTENTGDIKFGVVGFRDDHRMTEQLEYTAKNFTPDLVGSRELVKLLGEDVKATRVGSRDYVEEVFAGIQEGIHSNWREGATRFIILIGDASSHVLGHEKNTLNKDENALLREINENKINLLAMHLADPRAENDHAIARQQFSTLATIKGRQDESAIYSINTEQTADFENKAQMIVARITDLYANTRQQSEVDGQKTTGQASQETDLYTNDQQQSEVDAQTATDQAVQTRDIAVVDAVWQAALIEYIGQAANPPKDIVAWVVDKDLTDIYYKALDVRVLITKEQLSNLITALDRLLHAMHQSQVSQGQFFDALQSISGQTLKRPEDIGDAARLSDTGLLPAFVNSLPYKSDILSLTLEQFGSMTSAQRADLEAELQGKLSQYAEINAATDTWHAVNEDDPNSIVVHPLLLDYLP